ncbi:protein kinase [Stylonychia lemnae]|uniref:Protein kinase n=1 Tax=Stylonychia lemnae TaxID=5949 RepID=A0A078A3Y8_STYLE|nr:protein kinase [Stylonychia lemnae]|eukprot:CDW75474.1 protein kinase [Stylonychia lemnae]
MNTHNNLIGLKATSSKALNSFRQQTSNAGRNSSSKSRSSKKLKLSHALKQAQSFQFYDDKQLAQQILNGDLDTLKLFSKVSVNWRTWVSKEHQMPLIHLVIQSRQSKSLEYLIEKGFNLDQKSSTREETPLHLSCRLNICEMVKILLQNGAIANVQDTEKLTPLHLAMKSECLDCIQQLVSYGASMKLRDHQHYSPMHYGIIYGQGSGLETLLQLGVDPKEEWKKRYYPIHLAAQRGSINKGQWIAQGYWLKLAILIISQGFQIQKISLHQVVKTNYFTQTLPMIWELCHVNIYYCINPKLEIGGTKDNESQLGEEKKTNSNDSMQNNGMKFTILNNKKGEKLVGMTLDDGSTVYVNLKKLMQNDKASQKQQKNTKVIDYKMNSDPMRISEHLTIGDRIGEGAHAQVFCGEYMGSKVAIKRFRNDDNHSHKAFLTEVDILMSFKGHPNIILFLGGFKQGPFSYIVTEFAKHLNLSSYIKKIKRQEKGNKQREILTLESKIRWALQIARGANYLHKQEPQILHRDFKAENILVISNDLVKICDFGPIDDNWQQTETIGTVPWMAPEFLSDKIFTHKSDIYSYGVLLWEIFTEDELYPELRPIQIHFQVIHNDLRPEMPKDINSDIKALIEICWHKLPGQRPEFDQIIKMLKQLKKEIKQSKIQNSQKKMKLKSPTVLNSSL